jgi:transcriptional regulator with XRE-family HTH domain
MEHHIGDRLRELRKLSEMSQQKLGSYIGREQQEIAHWEKHGRILASDLPELARVLHVPVISFFTEEELNNKDAATVDWVLQLAGASLSPRSRAALVAFLRTLAADDTQGQEG